MTDDQIYLKHRDKDPFKKIAPALLNSADLDDYIKTIKMVTPYHVENLRGVTLRLTVGNRGVYWDEKHRKVEKEIDKDGYFVLKSNTIAYVQIAETIRLPAYIIARFNLRVTLAYRGILLGTGPIVDPGFYGQLNIPLHNLTNNEYVFAFNESLIEVEFTKLSPNRSWNNDKNVEARSGPYREWIPADKVTLEDRGMDYYLNRAYLGKPIESSLPSLKDNTQEAIDKAAKLGEKVDTSLNRINIGLLFSFGALLGAIIAIVNVFRGDIKEFKDKKYDDKIRNLIEQHQKDSIRMDSMKQEILKIEK